MRIKTKQKTISEDDDGSIFYIQDIINKYGFPHVINKLSDTEREIVLKRLFKNKNGRYNKVISSKK